MGIFILYTPHKWKKMIYHFSPAFLLANSYRYILILKLNIALFELII